MTQSNKALRLSCWATVLDPPLADPVFAPLWRAPDHAARLRVVIDQVAS
jgi:hypothetical protein